MQVSRKYRIFTSLVGLPLMLSPLAHAQYDQQRHSNFSQGVYQGGRGGSYDQGQDSGRGNYGRGSYNGGNDNRGNYNRGNDGQYQGHGIGTGRGALIGGAGGAALGAVFGGGLKGSLVGGAAGAGIGAFAGHEHQKTVRRHDYEQGYGPR